MGPATQELVHVLKAAHKTILKDCLCNDRWMESALRQGGDLKETFAQIPYDLQWYYVMGLCCIFLEWIFWDSWTPPKWILQLVDCVRKLSERDNDSVLRAAKRYQEDFKDLLRGLIKGGLCLSWRTLYWNAYIYMQCLATQLLSELEFLAQFQAWPAMAKKNYHKELHAANRNSLCLITSIFCTRR